MYSLGSFEYQDGMRITPKSRDTKFLVSGDADEARYYVPMGNHTLDVMLARPHGLDADMHQAFDTGVLQQMEQKIGRVVELLERRAPRNEIGDPMLSVKLPGSYQEYVYTGSVLRDSMSRNLFVELFAGRRAANVELADVETHSHQVQLFHAGRVLHGEFQSPNADMQTIRRALNALLEKGLKHLS